MIRGMGFVLKNLNMDLMCIQIRCMAEFRPEYTIPCLWMWYTVVICIYLPHFNSDIEWFILFDLSLSCAYVLGTRGGAVAPLPSAAKFRSGVWQLPRVLGYLEPPFQCREQPGTIFEPFFEFLLRSEANFCAWGVDSTSVSSSSFWVLSFLVLFGFYYD